MTPVYFVTAFVFFLMYEVSSHCLELSKTSGERLFWASSQVLALIGMFAYALAFILV